MRTSRIASVTLAFGLAVALAPNVRAVQAPEVDYRVLATNKTSTMEKELNEAAEAGFRFRAVMGGETAIGGNEVVAVVSRVTGVKGRFAYKLLATSKTSTMERELQQAADAGFEYRDQTVFKSAFGGEEVVCILERDEDAGSRGSRIQTPGDSQDLDAPEGAASGGLSGLSSARHDGRQDRLRRQGTRRDHAACETAMRVGACASAVLAALALGPTASQQDVRPAEPPDGYLTWTAAKAEAVGRSTRVVGRVGGIFDLRVTNTDRSTNYKLRATWMTGPVIRAAARLAQLAERLTNAQTEALVREAEAAGDTTIMVEIDPNEGSGVIPLDWLALLGPRTSDRDTPELAKGRNTPALRDVRALSGVFRRDYNYEAFWIVFPLRTESGRPLFPEGVAEAELVVRIYNKEGRVRWPVPASARPGRQAGSESPRRGSPAGR